MKSILFAAVMSFGLFAQACPNPEAQFVATVADVQPTAVEGQCQVQLKQIKTWNENQLCPLDVEAALQAPIITTQCQLKAGDDASGVLVLQASGTLSF